MNIRIWWLVLALVLALSGCAQRGGERGGQEPESGGESGPGEGPVEPEGPAQEDGPGLAVVLPAEWGYWTAHAMHWIDGDRLVVAFQVRDSFEGLEDEVLLLLYDVRDGSERLVAELGDGYVGHLASDGRELVVTTSAARYVYALPGLELVGETDNLGRDWGANTVGGLAADRDDVGIVILSYDDADYAVRVAESTADYLYDSPVWSPDGNYLRYSKYWGYVGDPIDIVVADREGNPVCEIAVPEYESYRYWSGDSRYILSCAHDELGGMVRVYDAASGEELAAYPDPNTGDFRDVRDVWGTKVAGWREGADGYHAFVYDALTGESRDVMALEAYCDLAFSTDGRWLAIGERENLSRTILLAEVG